MKYLQISAMGGLVLSLALCALALGGCELFAKDPPRLVIKNESPTPITRVEFWKETPETEEIGNRVGVALIKQVTDFNNYFTHLKEYIVALHEYAVAADKVAQTTPPLIADGTVISVGGSGSWDLEAGKSYIARVNGVLSPVSMNRGSLDTVYVFDGKNLSEKER
ncbi:MAG: hypothetical protein LBK62_08300 [Treponema sp.]|jgi:hypothetical protein|nr:hypothetical protein [Treponema sp.]